MGKLADLGAEIAELAKEKREVEVGNWSGQGPGPSDNPDRELLHGGYPDYDWITETFAWFDEPDLGGLDELRDRLEEVGTDLLDSGGKQIDGHRGLAEVFGDWDSDAVVAFRDRFAESIPIAVDSQANNIKNMAHLVDCTADVIREAQASIEKLGNEAKDALEELGGPADLSDVLAMAGIFASLVSIPATGGSTGAMTFAAISAGISTGNLALSIERSDVHDVINDLKAAVAELKDHMETAFSKVEKKINDDKSEGDNWLDNNGSKDSENPSDGLSHFLLVPKPNIISEDIDYNKWSVE